MPNTSPAQTLAFVGSVNRPVSYFRTANGRGISVLRFDEANGALTPVSETGGVDNPNYLAVDAAGRTLYAVSEVGGWHEGVVTAYRIDPAAGALTYINKQPTLGSITAHASFDRTGRWLLVANYRMGEDGVRPPQALVVFPIEADGGLGAPAASVAHTGHGPNPARQEGPHAHCALASPDNRHVLVADLGIDRIVVYAFDAATGALAAAAQPFVRLAPGSGPRHLAFHPSLPVLYVINELESSVTVLSWDAVTGGMQPLQSLSTLPTAWEGESHCSDVQVSPDGRFLYGANRGHDSIFFAAIDATSGRLDPVGHQPTLGATPRQFSLDPSGKFLAVANQDADCVVVLARDAATGRLADTGQRATTGTPMCVKFARYG
jgi:6-phosphogluconolactonase